MEYLSQRERATLDREKAAHTGEVGGTPTSLAYYQFGHDNTYVRIWYFDPREGILHTSPPVSGARMDHTKCFGKKYDRNFENLFQGRYDPAKKTASILVGKNLLDDPRVDYFIRHEILPQLRRKFNLEDYHIFK